MSFDFSTLVTDRTQADVNRVKQIAEKIKNGTASESELAEFNSAAMKGAYNYTDLNRVTAAMEALKAKLEGYGYAVPGYQRIQVPHPEFKTSRLPEGYTELAWIESTGTQYVDAGFKPNQDTRIVLDFQVLSSTGVGFVFGSRAGFQNSAYELFLNGNSTGMYDSFVNHSYAFTGEDVGRHYLDKNKNVTVLDGATYTHTYASFQSAYSMMLFSVNASGTAESRRAVMRLYSCQIYDNGTLVRDYVPCRNPYGEVGLYDLVTAAFFGNSGTGSFVAGAIPRKLPEGYTQVEYIESSGTQYIDTEFQPNQDTKVVMDVQSVGVNTADTGQSFFGARNGTEKRFYATWHRTNAAYYAYYYNTSRNVASDRLTDRMTVTMDKNILTMGNSVSVNVPVTGTFECETNMYLFACNLDGVADYFSVNRVYSCQIYDNGTLTRDFVPCKNSDGVHGLIDLADGVFYQNAGTGAFAAGEEIAPPEDVPIVEEYDPYLWYEFDWPTRETMAVYIMNLSVIRAALTVMASTPMVPSDMVGLVVKEANDIEVILMDVYHQINIMTTTFIPCGEALCGGDNL